MLPSFIAFIRMKWRFDFLKTNTQSARPTETHSSGAEPHVILLDIIITTQRPDHCWLSGHHQKIPESPTNKKNAGIFSKKPKIIISPWYLLTCIAKLELWTKKSSEWKHSWRMILCNKNVAYRFAWRWKSENFKLFMVVEWESQSKGGK